MAEQSITQLFRQLDPLFVQKYGAQWKRATPPATVTPSVGAGAASTALTQHAGLDWIEAHPTKESSVNRTRAYYSVNFGIIGGAGVDESNNILSMLNTVGLAGGGTVVICAIDPADPIHIAKTISIYYSNVHVVFPPSQVITYEDKASLRIMGDYAQITRKVDGTAMKLHVASTVVSNETVLELSATDTALMDAEANPALRIVRVGDKIVVRGQNDASGKSIEKDTSFVKALAKVGSYWQITCTDELDYTFQPTYPASEWPADLTTGTTIYVIEGSLITVNTAVGDTIVTVTDNTVFTPGCMVEVGDNRNEYAMNASAITGAGNPYKNPANLEQAQVTYVDPDGVHITLDRSLCRATSTTYYAFVALMVPVVNSTIEGARISYVDDGIRSANALQITYSMDCHIHHCYVNGGFVGGVGRKGHGLRISYSYKCSAYTNHIENAAYVGSGEGYGITIYYATAILVDGNTVAGCRHNYLLQLATDAMVINNYSFDDYGSGVDLHGVYSVKCLISTNKITGSSRNAGDIGKKAGIRVGNTSHSGGDHYNTIQNNTITGYTDTDGDGMDIFGASTGNDFLYNTIVDCYNGFRFGLNSSQITPVQTIANTRLIGNTFTRCINRTVEIIAQPVYDNDGTPRSNGKFSNITMIDNVSDGNDRQWEITGVATDLGITNVIMSGNKVINPLNTTTTYYGISVKYVDGFVHIYDNNVSKAQRGIYLQGNGVCHVIGNKTANTVQADPFTDGTGNTSINYIDAMTAPVTSTAFTTNTSITNNQPTFDFIESDASTNEKVWRIQTSAGDFYIQLLTDVLGSPVQMMRGSRTGTTIDSIEWAATTIVNTATAIYLTAANTVASGIVTASEVAVAGAGGRLSLNNQATNASAYRIYSPSAGVLYIYDVVAGAVIFITGTSGNLSTNGGTISGGAVSSAFDSDVTSYFGRAAIGFITSYSDYASFSHVDNNNTTDYALLQYLTGATYLNAKNGQSVFLRINNVTVGQVSSTGLAVTGTLSSTGDTTVGGNLAVTGNLGTWTSVTFSGTWADQGSDSAGRYRKFADVVFVEGFVARSGTTGFSIFTLPSGYRPAKTKIFSTIAKHGGNQVVCKIEISTSGVVSMTDPIPAAAITYVMLDGIQFSTS